MEPVALSVPVATTGLVDIFIYKKKLQYCLQYNALKYTYSM